MVWRSGLYKSILDPKNVGVSTDLAVVITDKYPKARHHYLVLPKEHISSIFELNKTHLSLLNELHLLATNVIALRREQVDNFKIGFHAQPSMEQLHLHVISKDFVSDSLKTKKHWNSFNTKLFIPFEKLYAQLNAHGCIGRLPETEVKELLAEPLVCNQCEFVAKNIPILKTHLLQHLESLQKN